MSEKELRAQCGKLYDAAVEVLLKARPSQWDDKNWFITSVALDGLEDNIIKIGQYLKDFDAKQEKSSKNNLVKACY